MLNNLNSNRERFCFFFREIVRRSSVKIDTVLSYCRFGILNNDLEKAIPEFQRLGVGIINAAPIGMGLLTEKGPPSWHPAQDSIKTACREAVQYAKVCAALKRWT